jgi:hypothetical protein
LRFRKGSAEKKGDPVNYAGEFVRTNDEEQHFSNAIAA